MLWRWQAGVSLPGGWLVLKKLKIFFVPICCSFVLDPSKSTKKSATKKVPLFLILQPWIRGREAAVETSLMFKQKAVGACVTLMSEVIFLCKIDGKSTILTSQL